MSERFINPAVAAVPPSGIRKFFDTAATMKDVISLGIGEPDFVTPYHIRNAAIESLLDGETQYTGNYGILSLRREIADFYENRYGVRYDPEHEVLVTVGASEGIDISLRAVLRPGDEVLVPDPGYVSYAPCVRFAGGIAVPVPLHERDAFKLDADEMRKRITKNTRAIILPFPNNPTGAVMTREELLPIARIAEEFDLLVVSDEIYSELIYDGVNTAFASLPGMRERTVTINGFSKAFAMTGWRMGYLCAETPLIGAIAKIHQYAIMCAPRQGQVAAERALAHGRADDYADVSAMRESYDRRRRLMLNAFRSMGLPCFEPKGAFYTFPSIKRTGLSSEMFCSRLLAEQKVVCVPGDAFGECGEGHVRCCYATGVDKLMTAFARMQTFIESL